jgi:hypothetical protein
LAIVTAKMNIRNNQGIQASLHLFSIISRNEFGIIITFRQVFAESEARIIRVIIMKRR